MSIQMACPGCGASYTLSDELRGKKVRCKKCEELFAVNGVAKGGLEDVADPPAGGQPAARTAAAVRRRGEDGNGPARSATRTAGKPVRRRGEDLEDDTPPSSKKGAAAQPDRSKTPLIIGGAVVGGLLLVGGVVGAIVLLKGDPPPKQTQSGGQPQNFKQPDPALNKDAANVGAEDQKAVAAEDYKAAEPPPNLAPGERLSQDVVNRVRRSTVYIRVLMLEQGMEASGSGFFGAEPGIILTNAHVLGMLHRGASPPTTIRVVMNSGEEDEWASPGEILGVDPSSDLAVLKIRGPQDKMPKPLKVVPTSSVRIGQDVFVVGFPRGYQVNKAVSVRRSSVSAWVRDDQTKELRRIQMEGGADPGNSGGPVINTRGEVVGVLVEGFRGSTICRSIPGDHVFNVLNGRVAAVSFHEPYRAGPGQIKVPVEVHTVDPLGRIQEVGIDSWKGPPGNSRSAATSQPEATKGDSEHQSLALTYTKDKHVAIGELTLPDKSDGEEYWSQPFSASTRSGKQWANGTVASLILPAAERRPATLAVQHSSLSRPVEMISKAIFRIDTGGDVRELAVEIKTKLTESTRSIDNQGTADVALQYEKVEMSYLIDGQPLDSIKNNDRVFRDIKYMRALLKVDRFGTVIEHKTDLSNVPPASRSFLASIGNQVEVSMATLAPPIPGQQVPPKHEWEGKRLLGIGGGPMAPLKMKYQYVGSRRRGVRDEAVIAVTGDVEQQAQNVGFQQNPGMQGPGQQLKASSKAKGFARGTAIVDLSNGQVVMARTLVDIDTEFTIPIGNTGLTDTGRGGGRLELSIKRGR